MENWPDAAFTPFRCAKGSTWEGGMRVPGIAVWPGMIDADRATDGLFCLIDLFNTVAHASPARAGSIPDDRFIDGVDQTSFLLGDDAVSNRKYVWYWLLSNALRPAVGEYKFMIASTSDDDPDTWAPAASPA